MRIGSPTYLLVSISMHVCMLSCFSSAQHYEGRRQWQPTAVLLPGESHGRRSLVGCSPWCLKESDMTEQLHFHFSPSCLGEGNGNPLQCSCLENPRDRGGWWAAVYGVAQSQTWLTRLSSSSRHYEILWTVALQAPLLDLIYGFIVGEVLSVPSETHVNSLREFWLLIPTYYAKVGIFILHHLVLSVSIFIKHCIILLCVLGQKKAIIHWSQLYWLISIIHWSAGDIIFQKSEQWGLYLLCFWEVGRIIEFSLF